MNSPDISMRHLVQSGPVATIRGRNMDQPDIIDRVAEAYVVGRCRDCGRNEYSGQHHSYCQSGLGRTSFVEGVALGIRYAERFLDGEQSVTAELASIDGRSLRCFAEPYLAQAVYQLLEEKSATCSPDSQDFWSFWTGVYDSAKGDFVGCPNPDVLFVRGFVLGLGKALREELWVEHLVPGQPIVLKGWGQEPTS